MKNSPGIARFLFAQLLLISTACCAVNADDGATLQSDIVQHPLARLLVDRFAATSSNPEVIDAGFLRNLGRLPGAVKSNNRQNEEAEETDFEMTTEDTDMKTDMNAKSNQNSGGMALEFGPSADWSCTVDSNRGFDYDSCTLSEASKSVEGGCSWCPLGGSTGVCLRAGQAAVVNDLENEHLLHLRCYNDNDDVIDETATAFWDEAMSCFPHSKADCGGDHGKGDHNCIYCDVAEPAMGLCLSVDLWDNMVISQALEDFDEDVSTGDQIRLDQVIHCSYDHTEDLNDGLDDDGLWSERCGWNQVTTAAETEECLSQVGCAVLADYPFPGLFGRPSGMYCVTLQQEQAMAWAVQVLQNTGWVLSYQ